MLAGSRCRIDIGTFENDMNHFYRKDDVLTSLIHLGYLAYDYEKEEVYIPNEEVRGAFFQAVRGTDWSPVTEAIRASDDFTQSDLERGRRSSCSRHRTGAYDEYVGSFLS